MGIPATGAVVEKTPRDIMKQVLMIAYHFPPIQGSSGLHRTVQFAKHLPDLGWHPIVVTVHPRAFPATGNDLPGEISSKCVVKRAFAFDSARHLSIKGRYFGLTAIPDRWVSWWPGGVWECLQAIRKYKPHAIWSTFPIATAHMIALTVHRLTGLPWIADFRDPMIQKGNPGNHLVRKAYQSLEKKIVKNASSCVTVTQSALSEYVNRYPEKDPTDWQLIPNGYDESLFEPCEGFLDNDKNKLNKQRITMLHSGILYGEGRSPKAFLKALKSYLGKSAVDIEVVFRGCGNETSIMEAISDLQLDDMVSIGSSVSYSDAIREMVQSDILIVFQGSVYNKQIPAKIYEYIRSGRPILALTDENGETARFLKKWDGVYIADMESSQGIEQAMIKMVDDLKSKKKLIREKKDVDLLSRAEGAKQLAGMLNKLSS